MTDQVDMIDFNYPKLIILFFSYIYCFFLWIINCFTYLPVILFSYSLIVLKWISIDRIKQVDLINLN